jgi:hypothetical protein
MKKQLLLLATLGTATFLVGCASTSTQRAASEGSVSSQLAFTPVTSPKELVKWAHDFPTVRVMESYTMAAPATVEAPVADLPTFSVNLPPGSVFVEAAGGESGTTYRVIRHTPHQR